jgi:hypothetical protein
MRQRPYTLTRHRLEAIIEALTERLAGELPDECIRWAYTGALKWALQELEKRHHHG